jgi:hypothetical protein
VRSPKPFQPGATWRNINLALHGTKFSREVLEFGESWVSLMATKTRLSDPRCVDFLNEVEAYFCNSIKAKDGSFFRALANWIEQHEQEYERERLWLLALCFNWTSSTRKQVVFFECKDLQRLAKERIGWDVDERRLRTICAQLGIRFKHGKEGRPRKTRTNSKR